MNSDVQKSLGYLKKSLKMSKRAIANAVSQDAQVLAELTVIATGINNLINEIETLEQITVVISSLTVPVTLPPVAPVAPVTPVSPVSVANDNGIDFLVP